MELQRAIQRRLVAYDGEKESILKQIKVNLDKGYGEFEARSVQDLTKKGAINSQVIEALAEALAKAANP